MKKLIILSLVAAAFATPALADHKAGHTQNNPDAPGQDRACLVTTSGGISGQPLSGKWLPRKAVEKQADNQTTFLGTHTAVQTQEGCEGIPSSLN